MHNTLGHIANLRQERAAAGQHYAFEQRFFHPHAQHFVVNVFEDLLGARFQNFVQLAAAGFTHAAPSPEGSSTSAVSGTESVTAEPNWRFNASAKS